jgi:hypothetical protein
LGWRLLLAFLGCATLGDLTGAAQAGHVGATASLSAQADQVGVPVEADPDQALVADLQARGTKIERPRVVVWFAADLLSRADADRWADLISRGVDDVEKLLDLTVGPERVEYYVDERLGSISHSVKTVPPRTFLSGSRVKSGAAPYLHEAAHHFVFRYTRFFSAPVPLWIVEGFASYVEDEVSEIFGGIPGRVFTKTGNRGVDAEAREVLTTSFGRDVLPFIGRAGTPKDIVADREHVGRSFYVLAQSFTKYLVRTIGIKPFATSFLPVMADLDRLDLQLRQTTGRSLEQLRTDWLAQLQAS